MAGDSPATKRVPPHTEEEITEQISRNIEGNVYYYATQDRSTLDARLRELDREWDIQCTLEASAAAVSLIGLGLGRFLGRLWYVLPAAVAGFLFQHAVQGWCLPVTLFRHLGVRTVQEIDQERYALKALRGDFSRIPHQDNPLSQEALQPVHDT